MMARSSSVAEVRKEPVSIFSKSQSRQSQSQVMFFRQVRLFPVKDSISGEVATAGNNEELGGGLLVCSLPGYFKVENCFVVEAVWSSKSYDALAIGELLVIP